MIRIFVSGFIICGGFLLIPPKKASAVGILALIDCNNKKAGWFSK